tara:strand:- start:1315 stop:1806 length:492 start_codon:yes stop_codon:yes gene_type:complete
VSKIDIVDLLELARAEILRLREPLRVEYGDAHHPVEKDPMHPDVSAGWNSPLRLRLNAIKMSAVGLTANLRVNGVTKSSEQVRRYITGVSIPSEEIKSHISSIVGVAVYDIWPPYIPLGGLAGASARREEVKRTHIRLTKARQDALESRKREAALSVVPASPG